MHLLQLLVKIIRCRGQIIFDFFFLIRVWCMFEFWFVMVHNNVPMWHRNYKNWSKMLVSFRMADLGLSCFWRHVYEARLGLLVWSSWVCKHPGQWLILVLRNLSHIINMIEVSMVMTHCVTWWYINISILFFFRCLVRSRRWVRPTMRHACLSGVTLLWKWYCLLYVRFTDLFPVSPLPLYMSIASSCVF